MPERLPAAAAHGARERGERRSCPHQLPGLLAALDRYPYGCTEQTASRALPLLYVNEMAISAGLDTDVDVRERVQTAIGRVLGNQGSNGAFGLWNSYGGSDTWLDAYVTDFLLRARDRNYDVPERAMTAALDNLENRVAYASDFESGGEDIAYALYVLAGRAAHRSATCATMAM
ncbi:MAG: hypothetical protein HPM95_20665 [Alphaproteobacteria bacterium]|nr:hypothetical protein [Alphaproteobacteria bacterium]